MAVILAASSSPINTCSCGPSTGSTGNPYDTFSIGKYLGHCGIAPPSDAPGDDASNFINNGRPTGCKVFCRGDADCYSCCSCCCSDDGTIYSGSKNSCNGAPKDAADEIVPEEVEKPEPAPIKTSGDCKSIPYEIFFGLLSFLSLPLQKRRKTSQSNATLINISILQFLFFCSRLCADWHNILMKYYPSLVTYGIIFFLQNVAHHWHYIILMIWI